MRLQHRLTGALAANAILLSTLVLSGAGCLSLGGKTTYTSETPETKQRLDSLETRVGVLERAVLGTPIPPGTPIGPGFQSSSRPPAYPTTPAAIPAGFQR